MTHEPIDDLDFFALFDHHAQPRLETLDEYSEPTFHVFGDPTTRRPVVACRTDTDGTHDHRRFTPQEQS